MDESKFIGSLWDKAGEKEDTNLIELLILNVAVEHSSSLEVSIENGYVRPAPLLLGMKINAVKKRTKAVSRD